MKFQCSDQVGCGTWDVNLSICVVIETDVYIHAFVNKDQGVIKLSQNLCLAA